MPKKIFITVFILINIIVILALINSYFPQVFIPYLKTITPTRKELPLSYTIPKTRKIPNTNSELSGTPLFSYYGLNFRVPFVLTAKDEKESWVNISFNNDRTITLMNLKDSALIDVLTAHMNAEDQQKMKSILGEKNIKNNYGLAKWILNTSPDDLKMLSNENDIRVNMMLVPLKVLLIKGSGNSIYDFVIKDFRGFQIGNPQDNAVIQILLFDENNKIYNIMIKGNTITQKDIDSILNNISPANS